MSNAPAEPTNRPIEGTFKPLSYGLSVQFHPAIKLDRKKGMEFAPKLSSAIDARGLDLQENRWLFEQPVGNHPAGKFIVSVGESSITIEAAFPSDAEELFEHRYSVILAEFQKSFKPALMLGFSSLVRGTLDVDGDARKFFSENVTPFELNRLKKLGRPVHLFGIRLFMPPFQAVKPTTAKGKGKKTAKPVTNTTDWMVDVKAESLMEDPSKLFLEAQAQWQPPATWDNKATLKAVNGVSVVSAFLRNQFISFLMFDSHEKGN